MHNLESQNNLPSKDKELTRSSQDNASSLVSTEEKFTIPSDVEPTKPKSKNMGNDKNTLLEKLGGNLNEIQNEDMK